MLERQPKLLLISNDPHFTYLITRYGARSGCRVSHAASVEIAIDSMQLERPSMVLLHLGATGRQTEWSKLRRLQASRLGGAIPITVIAALADEVSARAEGASYWLWQPVLYNDFLSLISAAEGSAQ